MYILNIRYLGEIFSVENFFSTLFSTLHKRLIKGLLSVEV